MDKILVQIGDGNTASAGQTLVSYALGSCIGVCLYDNKAQIAGMVHAVLPSKNDSLEMKTSQQYRYADQGIKRLISQMCVHGAKKSRLTAKLVGGAQMFQTINYEWDIGKKNVETAKKILAAEGIPLLAEDTGSDYGRTVWFTAEDGRVKVEAARHASIIL